MSMSFIKYHQYSCNGACNGMKSERAIHELDHPSSGGADAEEQTRRSCAACGQLMYCTDGTCHEIAWSMRMPGSGHVLHHHVTSEQWRQQHAWQSEPRDELLTLEQARCALNQTRSQVR